LRQRRESDAARAALDGELRTLYERDAAARGRVAIARELHDVVAHHVSLIAVRAATAAYQVEDVSPAAGHAFDEIAAQARIALDELRSVLGVLRAPDGAAPPLGPQPRLADLPELVDRMRAGGLSVAVRTLGTPRLMTDATELCCYRVVQEALTNVMRHEPKATAQVDLAYDLDVTITVTNSVRLRSSGVDRPAAGFGLTGMRERVLAVGGELRAGVRDGHFRVHLRIPTDSCTGEWP
jgi:signal transduction histidine kinase